MQLLYFLIDKRQNDSLGGVLKLGESALWTYKKHFQVDYYFALPRKLILTDKEKMNIEFNKKLYFYFLYFL